MLAEFFTHIYSLARIPSDWSLKGIIPVYKKGERLSPLNYKQISFHSVISILKIPRARKNIMMDEQAGFKLAIPQ